MRRRHLRETHTAPMVVRVLFQLLLLSLLATGAQADVGNKSTFRHIYCMGQSWRVNAYTSSESDILLLRGDDPVLNNVARALGRDLHWSPQQNSLINQDGKGLSLGQRTLDIQGEETELKVPSQLLNGAIYIPSNGLEGLLDCRVTVRAGSRGDIYVEPVLESIRFEEKGDTSTEMVIKTSVPVRKKIFSLNNPKRTVIDLVGVALPHHDIEVSHPVLGEVKLGQFQLAPSVTRVVLPSAGGVKVRTYRSLDLFEHQLTISWPKGMNPNAPQGQRVATVQIPKVDPGQERVPVIRIGPSDTQMASNPKPQPPVQVDNDQEPDQEPAAITASGEDPDGHDSEEAGVSERVTLDSASWEGSRLKLQFSKPVSYRWARVSAGKDRFVVDFPGVIFPRKKTALDSGIPGLESVRIVQNMPEPQPIVRLVCDLQTPLAVETESSNDTILYLSFPGRKLSAAELTSGVGFTSAQQKGSPQGRTICIDPGHGGSDPGAQNHSVGVNECQVTLDIALKLARILKSQGWNVVLTRTTDVDLTWAGSSAKQELGARAKVANDIGADLFVSIHANASVNSDINGTSIHWYKATDYKLAQSLESGVMSATGRTNRGLVKNRFYVLAHTQMPAVLIETAFLTNPTEGKLLADPDFRDRIARGIASGLSVYAAKSFPGTASRR